MCQTRDHPLFTKNCVVNFHPTSFYTLLTGPSLRSSPPPSSRSLRKLMTTCVATGIELVVLTHAVRGQRNGWESASECVRPLPDIERLPCQEKMEKTGTSSASLVLKSGVFRSTCNDFKRHGTLGCERHSSFFFSIPQT